MTSLTINWVTVKRRLGDGLQMCEDISCVFTNVTPRICLWTIWVNIHYWLCLCNSRENLCGCFILTVNVQLDILVSLLPGLSLRLLNLAVLLVTWTKLTPSTSTSTSTSSSLPQRWLTNIHLWVDTLIVGAEPHPHDRGGGGSDPTAIPPQTLSLQPGIKIMISSVATLTSSMTTMSSLGVSQWVPST